MLKPTLLAAVALLLPLAILPQAAPKNWFEGSWKLNPAKSKFRPGPAFKSESLSIPAAEGKVEVHTMQADGKELNWSYATSASGGASIPIEGLEGASVSGNTTGGRLIDHTWKLPNFTGTGHGVVSKNGKTMTYTMTGTDDHGQAVHNVMIFEKQ